MKFIDYHVHSTFSYDGQSSLFHMCQKAIDLGIEEIGFSRARTVCASQINVKSTWHCFRD